MKTKLALLTLAALSVLSLAHTAVAKEITSSDLNRYIQFIEEWTSLKYTGQPLPKIKVSKHELVQVYAYGDYEYAQAESKGLKLPTVNAVYDVRSKSILISDKIDMKDPVSELTIVHEMVHYLQDVTGYTASLQGNLACTENEAYDVQMLWQRIYNVQPETIQKTYQLSVLSAVRCMGDKTKSFPKLDLDEIK